MSNLKLESLLNSLNVRNEFDKTAAAQEAMGKDAMPPAGTVHKAPINQPAGDEHELEAVLGQGEADRRQILKDQMMSAAGAQKADESRQDPDEVHNVSIESKAKELMPPAGNAMAGYEGPMTPESKISAEAANLAAEYKALAQSAVTVGNAKLAAAYTEKAAELERLGAEHKECPDDDDDKDGKKKKDMKGMKGYKDKDYKEKKSSSPMDALLAQFRGQDEETTKSAEAEEQDRLLKIAEEYYSSGRVFGQGFLDRISEEQDKVASTVAGGGSDMETKVAEMEVAINTMLDFIVPLSKQLNGS